MKFHENPISGGRDRRTDGQTSMTKMIVVFRCFANMPKNGFVICGSIPISIFFCDSRLKDLFEYLDTVLIIKPTTCTNFSYLLYE